MEVQLQFRVRNADASKRFSAFSVERFAVFSAIDDVRSVTAALTMYRFCRAALLDDYSKPSSFDQSCHH